MAHRTGRNSKRKLNSQQAAASWLNQGILTVPLREGTKRPKAKKGWNQLRISEETIPDHFHNGDNVGGLWGEPSKWIVDIDLDWDEACEVAPYFLPETFSYGRGNRPGSHYLVRCREVATSKWTLRSGSVIAEIRSSGSQSVLPPSVHPDGDRYSITDANIPIVDIVEAELRRALNSISGAAVLLRYFPEGGSRHDYVHATAGGLLHAGWPEKRVRIFMDAFLAATEHLDDETPQRERTVENTIENFKRGNRIMGWQTLGQWVDGQALQAVRSWLTPAKRFELAPANLTDLEHQKELVFNTKLCDIPGLVGEVAGWAKKQSYYLQPSFDIASGLLCTALASSNHYVVSAWSTPLQPYLMLLAPTGAGKNSALDSVLEFSTKVGLDPYVYQGFQSFYALMDRLAEPPGQVCWLWDEIARHLAAARSTQSQDYTTISHLISIYGKANGRVAAMPGRKNDIPPLERPFLTLMGAAQPVQLMEAISSADITTGFLNRLILFDSGDRIPEVNPVRDHVFPARIRRAALELKKHEPRHTVTEIHFDGATYNFFRAFEQHALEQGIKGSDHEIWSRANQNSLILAGLVAVGVDPKRPRITQDIADWAVEIVSWGIKCWMTRINDNVGRTVFEKHAKRVERLIRSARGLADKSKKEKDQKFLQRGQMPRSVLMRNAGLRARELDEVLEMLIEGDTIGISEDDAGFTTYWPRG